MKALVALLFAAPAIARADAIAEGQELAKKGQYDQALAKFQEADRRSPRAETSCLIGLAHLRGGHAPEAEVRFAQCHARATDADPVPEWLDEVEAQLVTALAKLARIDIVATTGEPVTVSGWRDEPFTAQAIHLPPGHYAFTSGTATVELDVATDRETVTLAPREPPHPRPRAPEPPAHASTYVLGAAAGIAAIGLGVHLLALAPARSTLASDVDPTQYDHDYPAYQNTRIAVVGLYGAAAIALGIGLYLRHGEASVGATVDPRGAGMVTLEWRR